MSQAAHIILVQQGTKCAYLVIKDITTKYYDIYVYKYIYIYIYIYNTDG